MKKILFVCMGNICRSPMAEAIFRDAFKKQNQQFQVDSAATSRWEVGNPPHRGTQKILAQHDISIKGMRARQVTEQDFMMQITLSGWTKKMFMIWNRWHLLEPKKRFICI